MIDAVTVKDKKKRGFKFVKWRGRFFKTKLEDEPVVSDEDIYEHFENQQKITNHDHDKNKILSKREKRAEMKRQKKLLKQEKKGKKNIMYDDEVDLSDSGISLSEIKSNVLAHMVYITGVFIRMFLCIPNQADVNKDEDPGIEGIEEDAAYPENATGADETSAKECSENSDTLKHDHDVNVSSDSDDETFPEEDLVEKSKRFLDEIDHIIIHGADSLDELLADIERNPHQSHDKLIGSDDSFEGVSSYDTNGMPRKVIRLTSIAKQRNQQFIDELNKQVEDGEAPIVCYRRKNKVKNLNSKTSKSNTRPADAFKYDQEYDSDFPETTTSIGSTPSTSNQMNLSEGMCVPQTVGEIDEGIEEEYFKASLHCTDGKMMPHKKLNQSQNSSEKAHLPPLHPSARRAVAFEVRHETKDSEILKRIPDTIREKLRTPDRRKKVFISQDEIDMKMLRAEEQRLRMLQEKKTKASPKKLDKSLLERMEDERKNQLKIHLEQKMNKADDRREEQTQMSRIVS